MNDKINWFGRYLGCEYWYKHHSHKENEYCTDKLTTADLYCIVNNRHYKCKLILKELSDITEEDLEYLNRDIKNPNVKWTKSKVDNDFPHHLYYIDEIDFLRSKSYAIGIPKEYYITEKELKKCTQQ